MKKILSIIILWTAIPGGFGLAAEPCRSGAGGYCVKLAAVIPGLEFIQYEGSSFGDFLSSIYVFALGLVGISAFIMFVYAGFKYMTAGDNETRVKDARKKMGDASLGLILAFLSWLILRTINPDLTKKFDFNIQKLSAPAMAPPAEPVPPLSTLVHQVGLGGDCVYDINCKEGLRCDKTGDKNKFFQGICVSVTSAESAKEKENKTRPPQTNLPKGSPCRPKSQYPINFDECTTGLSCLPRSATEVPAVYICRSF